MLLATLVAATGVVIGATYMLRFARSLLFDDSALPERLVPDLRPRELLALAPLLLLIFWIGVRPGAWMERAEGTVARLAQPVATAALGAQQHAE